MPRRRWAFAEMKILLIEDDDLDAKAIERMLRRIGVLSFEVVRCDCLSLSLERLRAESFDVLLVDLGLPDSVGVDIVSRLIEVSDHSAIIVQTGYNSESAAMEAMAAGAQDYLIKGQFDKDSLLRAIRYAHGRQQTENRLREVNAELEETLRKLLKTQGELVRSERMSAIGQMSCGIAHDINNALTPIVASADYLLSREQALDDRGNLKKMLGLIRTSAEDAAGVIKRLRSFYSAPDAPQEEKLINVEELLDDVRALTKPKWRNEARAAGKEIDFVIHCLPGCFISGNEGEMREALMNLVFNAVHASGSRGLISIRASRNSEEVTISVSDDGAGMSEEMALRCFEPFASSKGADGTGLGLSTAHQIVQRTNGKIRVESIEGKGTTFFLQFPVAERKVEDPEVSLPSDAPSNFCRVLLSDDEEHVRLVTKTLLTQEGFDCETASDGEEAFRMFESGDYDLVITDRSMPGLSGDELARRVRESDSKIPIIMLTGYGEFMLAADELPEGVTMVVPKPFNVEKLMSAIAQATSDAR